MRWDVPPKPVNNQTRRVVKFAWFPVFVDECKTKVWLERYVIHETYRVTSFGNFWRTDQITTYSKVNEALYATK